MRDYLVYLSGPIGGLDFVECTDWREYATAAFPSHIQAISPLRAKRFLQNIGTIQSKSNSYNDHPLSKSHGINTRDRFDTLRSDAILVNLLGAKKVSIGTVMEIAWAHDHSIPVIAAIEPDGLNIHDHPMLTDSLDFVVHSLDEAIETVTAIVSPHEKYIHTRLNMVKLLREDKMLDTQTPPLPSV